MRNLLTIVAAFAFTFLAFQPAAAQEAGSEVSLTGCLAQEEEAGEEVEYLLEGVAEEQSDADEIELLPTEGVNMAPHVGHTVEVTGTVVTEDEEEGEHEEAKGEMEAEEEKELHVRVSALGHIAASCDEEGGR